MTDDLFAIVLHLWQALKNLLADLVQALMALPVEKTLGIALLALAVERIVGWPAWIQARLTHPVVWFGRMIADWDARLNTPQRGRLFRRLAGVFTMVFVILFWGGLALILSLSLRKALADYAGIAEALLAAPFLAQKSLQEHVHDVLTALRAARMTDSLDEARRQVSRIVGRDTAEMDESGIVRAAVESLAENTSDGVIAPAFWLALFGLPGIVIYKVINTADSMIGHLSDRYREFGWAAARLDDLANFLPARLTALLYVAAAALFSPRAGARALHVAWRDARKHVSPNAGWPEAAMAGALDIALGGPRSYQGRVVSFPHLGDGRSTLIIEDIERALSLYGRMLTVTLIIGLVVWIFLPR